ncbi:hypothetical protein JCM16303_006228 [Sporobolomyces ruberrimus]
MLTAVGQLCSTSNVSRNLAVARDLIKQAAKANAKVLFLPEATDFIAPREQVKDLSENLEHPGGFVEGVRKQAKESGVWINIGVHERGPDDENGRCYNTNLLIDDRGDIVSSYRKVHLFDVAITGGTHIMESSTTIRGNEIVPPRRTPAGKLGLATCFDLRFPELSLSLRRKGAEIISYPSAFTVKTGKAHWETLLRARAIETQCYVFAAAQAEADEGAIATAEVDLESLHQIRREIPLWEQRRNDVYPELNDELPADRDDPNRRAESTVFGTSVQSSLSSGPSLAPSRSLLHHPALVDHRNLDMSQKAFVACGQMCSTNDPSHNALLACSIIRRAAKLSAKLVMLPEGCDFIGTPDEVRELSKPLEESTFLNAVRKQAKESSCWVSTGVHESSEVEGRVYNSNVVIDSDGNIASKYEKIHLLDVDVQGGDSTQESELVLEGKRLTDPVQTPVGKLGLQVCYDLRFPEGARVLRSKGAQLIGYNAAWTARTGPPHWEVLLRARAIENQAYVLAPDQIGEHPSGRQSYGHAMIISPWGDILAQCADRPPAKAKEQSEDDGEFCMAEIDIAWCEELRESMPLMDQRRTDIYNAV